MNLEDLHNNFIQLENKLALEDEDIFVLWYYSRVKIFNELKKKYLDYRDGQLGSKDQKLLRKISFNKIQDLFSRNPFIADEKDFLILGHPRKKYIDNEWKDIYTDRILEDLENDFIYLEKPFRLVHKGIHLQDVYYTDIINILKRFKRFVRVSKAIINKSYYIENELKVEFGKGIEYQSILLNTYKVNKLEKYFYGKILDRVKPKLVFVVVWYANLGLINACREKNIPVIEIQHGVIDNFHLGYFWGAEIKEAYYSYFPSVVLTFGDYWNQKISLPNKNVKKIDIGFDFFSRELSRHNIMSLKSCDEVLFITQKSIGNQIRKFIIDFIADYPNIKIGIKIHPAEDISLYKKSIGKNELVSFYVSENIYELFSRYEYVCGVYSTALYESLAFGNSTIIISSIEGWQHMKDLIEENMVFSVSDAAELAKIILSEKKLKKSLKESVFQSYNPEKLQLILE
jgi:hypothetical protein